MASGSSNVQRGAGRQGLSGRRAAVAAAVAAATLVAAWAADASWSVAVLIAWDVAAATMLVWVFATVWRCDASGTERLAASEDDSRPAAEALLLAAGASSLIAVGFVLAEAGRAQPLGRGFLTALAVVSVLLAWAVVHTIFTLRYARLYYAPPVGGIDFHEGSPPDYSDFVYVALTIGMTFQVSDTALERRPIRRTAIHHALLSYLFGAVILAIAISSVASILGQ
jgi:uncharacterized membrane protein